MSGPTDPSPPIFQTLDRCEPFPYSTSEYVRRVLWQMVQATLYRLPIPRGYAWRRFLLKCFGAKLAHRAGVHTTTRIMHPWLLEMSEWSMLGPGTTVYNLGKVTIGAHSVISQNVYLCAGTHDYTLPNLPLLRPEIRIGAGVWIAAGAFIGPGAIVGDNSVVGACSVVIGEIPHNVVAAGNPARILKPRKSPPNPV